MYRQKSTATEGNSDFRLKLTAARGTHACQLAQSQHDAKALAPSLNRKNYENYRHSNCCPNTARFYSHNVRRPF